MTPKLAKSVLSRFYNNVNLIWFVIKRHAFRCSGIIFIGIFTENFSFLSKIFTKVNIIIVNFCNKYVKA